MKKKAYVSSTSKDLNEYRLAVNKTIKQMGYEDVAMEYYSAEGRPPPYAMPRRCDIYVCIVAWHYGSIPEGENKSFTEMEYDHARKHYKKMFIFLQNEKSLWPPYLMDGIAKNEASLGDSLKKDDGLKHNNKPGETYHADDRDRIIKFRKKLTDENLVDFFSTQDNLCQKLVIGLESLERIMRPANNSQLTEPLTGIECVGRGELIEKLKRYYKDTKTAVVSCIGKPGLGKSHVVRGFLKNFNKDDISPKDSSSLKAQWIFGWSFLNQGTDHDQGEPPTIILENSSTEFFANVLKFYGFEDFPYSEEQQAELLVELIKTEESLLILDGLDPLLEERDTEELLIKIQDKGKKLDKLLENLKKNDTEQLHEKKHSIKGLIQELKGLIDKVSDDKSVVKDRAMKVFLQKLCDETKKAEYHHKGLVIITTRKAFSDLDAFLENNIYREISLKSLDNEDGAKLLNT